MGEEDDTSEEIIDEVSDRVGPDKAENITLSLTWILENILHP